MVWILSLALAGPQLIDPSTLEAFEEPEAAAPSQGAWWNDLGDAQLAKAIDGALADNQELLVAEAGARQAAGATMSTASALLPSASFDVTAQGQPLENVAFCAVGRPDFLNQPDADWCWQGSANLNARWNLDVFGRSTTGYLAARYDAEAAKGNRDAQRLAIASRVANAYFDAVAAEQVFAAVQKACGGARF